MRALYQRDPSESSLRNCPLVNKKKNMLLRGEKFFQPIIQGNESTLPMGPLGEIIIPHEQQICSSDHRRMVTWATMTHEQFFCKKKKMHRKTSTFGFHKSNFFCSCVHHFLLIWGEILKIFAHVSCMWRGWLKSATGTHDKAMFATPNYHTRHTFYCMRRGWLKCATGIDDKAMLAHP